MVTFLCYNCDKTMKKQQVEKHSYQCRKPLNLVCIDCKKNFYGAEFDAHIACLSEKSMTWGQYAQKKPSQVSREEKDKKENVEKNERKIIDEVVIENTPQQFIGWRKSIKNAMKNQNKDQVKVDKIMKQVVDDYMLLFPECVRQDVENEFIEKVKKVKNYEVIQVPYMIKKTKL